MASTGETQSYAKGMHSRLEPDVSKGHKPELSAAEHPHSYGTACPATKDSPGKGEKTTRKAATTTSLASVYT